MSWGVGISAGGGNGVYSVGAIFALRTVIKIHFTVASGSSTGALQAPLVIADELDQLNHLYRNASFSDILKKRNWMWSLWKGGLYSSKPLQKMIVDNLDLDLIGGLWPEKRVIISATNYRSGRIKRCTNAPGEVDRLHEFALASSSIPLIMDGVNIDGDLYYDGGVLDLLPVDPIIEHSAKNELEGIVAISNFPHWPRVYPSNPTGIWRVAHRTFDLTTSEIARNDVSLDRCLDHVPKVVRIQPETKLGDSLEFETEDMRAIWKMGYDDAIKQWRAQIG